MRLLALFAKHWRPGEVKTRLAAAVGRERAAALHRLFLETLLSRLSRLAERRVLVFAPRERRDEFAALAGGDWELTPQGEGNLGDRLRKGFERSFANGASRVVLIGADSPTLPLEYLDEAFAALDRAPVVLGPSCDGGYYLVGATGRAPPIFDHIDWGTSAVWDQTQASLTAAACPCHILPTWYDVDVAADLDRLRAELAASSDDQPQWTWLQDRIDELFRGGQEGSA